MPRRGLELELCRFALSHFPIHRCQVGEHLSTRHRHRHHEHSSAVLADHAQDVRIHDVCQQIDGRGDQMGVFFALHHPDGHGFACPASCDSTTAWAYRMISAQQWGWASRVCRSRESATVMWPERPVVSRSHTKQRVVCMTPFHRISMVLTRHRPDPGCPLPPNYPPH